MTPKYPVWLTDYRKPEPKPSGVTIIRATDVTPELDEDIGLAELMDSLIRREQHQ
jgi:hypothetical protein